MMEKIKNAQKLLKMVDSKLDNWNERSSFKILGVGNLSQSDMDSIKYYAETLIKNSQMGLPAFHGLMAPMGDIKNVLIKSGLID